MYRELYHKGFLNYANTPTITLMRASSIMANLINTYNPQTGTFGLANTPEAKNAFLHEAAKRNTDWFDLLP